ncbi:dnaJ homolog subfamily B member 9-like isoform 1-T2 [Synchiropus picturatus]
MAATLIVLLLVAHILLYTELVLADGDYYDVLGVTRDATKRQIQRAFHQLALKYHPDRNKSPGAERKFRQIAEAYETLSDDERRRNYDRLDRQPLPTSDHNFKQFFQSFNFDDVFRDPFAQWPGHHAHREAKGGRRRGSQQRMFGDMYDDLDKLFTSFNAPHSRTTFAGAERHCRTVTQRRGNMVNTFVDCS